MGCICKNNNEKYYEICQETKKPIRPDINIKYNSKDIELKNYPKFITSLTKLQSLVRGNLFRSLFKKPSNPLDPINFQITEFNIIKTDKITDEELEELFRTYPSINSEIIPEKLPPVEFPNKVIYYGEWDKINKLRHGRGIQIFPNNAKYIGNFLNGNANGKGKLIHPNGDVYDGDWENDKPNGYGIYKKIDGSMYEGEWKNDKKNGKGKEKWSDGTEYEGEYLEDKRHGKGVFKYANGSIYEGEFLENNMNGDGVFIFCDKRKYEGTWVNNKLEGRGVFTWPDGRKYEGEYINDKKDGYGVFEWNDGKKYRGPWKNGKQHGIGEFYDPEIEDWKKGEWKNGKRERWLISQNDYWRNVRRAKRFKTVIHKQIGE